MTADAASPDTPTDPRTAAEVIALDWFSERVGTMGPKTNLRLVRDLINRLSAAGLLSLSGDSTQTTDGEDEGSLRSRASGTPAETIAEALREYQLTIGPNTRDLIAGGMTRVHLSGGERRDIGLIAAKALGLEEA